MRLTKKDDLFSGGYELLCAFDEAFSKLGKLEDVEELCEKLVAQGYYYTRSFDGVRKESIEEFSNCLRIVYEFKEKQIIILYRGGWRDVLPIEHYGKTWALTEDELNK